MDNVNSTLYIPLYGKAKVSRGAGRSAVDTNDLEKQPDGNWIRKIIFNFPVPVNGAEVKELPLENETMVESICLLSLKDVYK